MSKEKEEWKHSPQCYVQQGSRKEVWEKSLILIMDLVPESCLGKRGQMEAMFNSMEKVHNSYTVKLRRGY